MSTAPIKVTRHVARDLLQSAALFKHEHSVVWEYVSNGLEYVDPGTLPAVEVSIDVKAKKIVVRDTRITTRRQTSSAWSVAKITN